MWTTMQAKPPEIFDRGLLRLRRHRAAPRFPAHDFLVRAAAEEIGERLEHLLKGPVERAVLTGPFRGEHITKHASFWAHGDCVQRFAAQGPNGVVMDEELSPCAGSNLDLYVSLFTLHTINDLPGALIQIRQALKPGGRFLAAFPGGETLKELRLILAEAEEETTGGASPRVHPFIDIRDAAGLLQRAGYAEPVADLDRTAVRYSEPLKLLSDLRAMGESNVLCGAHRRGLRRRTLLRAAELYRERFSDAEGRARATFEILYLSGVA
jgi:SAM-dependent methyltransferase